MRSFHGLIVFREIDNLADGQGNGDRLLSIGRRCTSERRRECPRQGLLRRIAVPDGNVENPLVGIPESQGRQRQPPVCDVAFYGPSCDLVELCGAVEGRISDVLGYLQQGWRITDMRFEPVDYIFVVSFHSYMAACLSWCCVFVSL